MRLHRPVHRLAPTALGLALVATSASVTAARADDVPGPPAHSAPRALEALEHVQEILDAPQGDEDLTLALLDLRQELPDLDRADRREARRAFARPTSPSAIDTAYNGAWTAEETAASRSTCDAPALLSTSPSYPDRPFCVHYVPADAQPGSRHRVSDAVVDDTVTTLDAVWQTEIGALGYRTPLPDGAAGGDGKVDVYLSDTVQDGIGIFGYAVPEGDPSLQVSPGYLVLENDFAELAGVSGTSAEGLRRVTAAHEFFHLVQFAYDADEHPWLLESTATWMEEQVFDEINDNRSFLAQGPVRRPRRSLDRLDGGAEYGSWAFHQLATERFGPRVVQRAFDHAAATRGRNSLPALDAALREVGSSLEVQFRRFASAATTPSAFWSEGAAFPPAATSGEWSLGRARPSVGWRSVSIDHLAAADHVFRPRAGLQGAWKLRLRVDAPRTAGAAQALVVFKDGRVAEYPFRLDRYGNGARTVPFSAREVSRVILTTANVSTWRNGRTTRFKATIRR